MTDKYDPWRDEYQGFDGRGKRNAYVCECCGRRIITEDVDAGTTPMLIGCRATDCGGEMVSQFYRVNPATPATHEWYRPTREWAEQQDAEVRDYVLGGGLVLREADHE
jgi:hypothetical protein